MPGELPADLDLQPLTGKVRPAGEWVTTFQLLLVVVDPYTSESTWLLDTGARVLRSFAEADCRTAWLVTAAPRETRLYLGPYGHEFLAFADPDRKAVKALGLTRLPALVHVRQNLKVADAAEGWDPDAWQKVVGRMADEMSWLGPVLPGPKDPAPFDGTPALAKA